MSRDIFSSRLGNRESDLPRRILVACHEIVISGGLLRFDRIASVLSAKGHELCFVTLADVPIPHRATNVNVLSFETSAQASWDAVMVPGAGFPPQTIAQLQKFKRSQFGVRVQHVLNDQQRYASFKAVNDAFAPHTVIFNNDDWKRGSSTGLSANHFHTLLGAVDTEAFCPMPRQVRGGHEWIVGGQATKNPTALIDALNFLGPEVALCLFGPDTLSLRERYASLIATSRLRLTGPLFGEDLVHFYQNVDCVVSPETMAGWANLAAEAMASGVPVICTRNGTTAFAHHEETALLVDTPSPVDLAAAIARLQTDSSLVSHICTRGRAMIEPYSWDFYTDGLLSIIDLEIRSIA